MFCPKCGTKNPNDGKFCRKCGTDIKVVSAVLSGKPAGLSNRKKQNSDGVVSLESAMGKLFMGLAFVAIAIILGYTGVAGGRAWWFWMLIPAFGMMGSGIARIMHLRQESSNDAVFGTSDSKSSIGDKAQGALPPNQTAYVSPTETKYQTGDLVPSSVIENTTRHLKTDSEGETMTLPKDAGN